MLINSVGEDVPYCSNFGIPLIDAECAPHRDDSVFLARGSPEVLRNLVDGTVGKAVLAGEAEPAATYGPPRSFPERSDLKKQAFCVHQSVGRQVSLFLFCSTYRAESQVSEERLQVEKRLVLEPGLSLLAIAVRVRQDFPVFLSQVVQAHSILKGSDPVIIYSLRA